MPITNPCRWIMKVGRKVGEVFFIHEGGSTFYHFSPHDCGIPGYEHYMAENLVFFANSHRHAADVLERMLKFRIRCWNTVGDDSYRRPEYAQAILDHKHLWKFVKAPRDQFYVVGWASNDTIF